MLRDIPVIITLLSPIAEARLGIPLGLVLNITPIMLILYALICACAIYFIGRLCLNLIYDKWISRLPLCERITSSIRSKGFNMVQRYGWFGLFLFVVVPIPGTGVYSGTLVSWLLDLPWWKSSIAVISGGTVSALGILMLGCGVMEIL